MRVYFSKRHENSIKDKRLTVTLPINLRVSILRTLNKYSSWIGPEWDCHNDTFYKATQTLLTFYGALSLRAYGENGLVNSDFEGVINSGWPPHVFDCIEAWFDHADDTEARKCEKELNDVLEINKSPWRFVNGGAMFINSEYLHEHVISQTLTLMREQSIPGALEEFTEACNCLEERKAKEAVVNAHKSVESVMKTILGKKSSRFGMLISELIKSGIIPEYYDGFLKNFEKLLLSVGKERNLPGRGHGQGQEPIEVPDSLAQFVVHLAGTMNLFLLNHWIATKGEIKDIEISEDDDIPF